MSLPEELADPRYWFEQAAYYQGLADMTANSTHGVAALRHERRGDALVAVRLAKGSQ